MPAIFPRKRIERGNKLLSVFSLRFDRILTRALAVNGRKMTVKKRVTIFFSSACQAGWNGKVNLLLNPSTASVIYKSCN